MREGDHKWTDAEKSRLLYLRDEIEMEWKDIAADLGLPMNKCMPIRLTHTDAKTRYI